MAEREFKHWGWGYADQQPDRAALEAAAVLARERLGFGGDEVEEPVPESEVELREPRLRAPEAVGDLFSSERHDRLVHSMGKAYRDIVRGFRGIYPEPPDLVARPRTEDDLEAILAYCEDAGAAAIPFGGGTSVVGGVEPRTGDRPSVSVDMREMNRLLELDESSMAARIQGGATGPQLEDALREHGLTLRHFPQSFEYSTLGGWVATRAGGHFATVLTHIDDLVESVRAITPTGEWESRRLPGSGAGPSPDRMLIGSEGILGVITEAWVRVRPRPGHRASAAAVFTDFADAAEAVREISQSGLDPSNCRLLDPGEAGVTGAGDGDHAVLVLGFESAHHPVDHLLGSVLEIAGAHGGETAGGGGGESGSGDGDAVSTWRSAFLGAPYLRDTLVSCGILSETFETAVTWDRFPDFHDRVMETARSAAAEVSGAPAEGAGAPRVSCRFTHVYPDGPAPYFTVLAPAVRGGEVEQWDEIKAAVSEALIDAGGTITHHHAVGRDHRPWYDRQRPDRFADALRAAKAEIDPESMLNPGVLIDPAAPAES